MNKSELRKIYLAKQKNLSASERKQKSAQIAERFFARFDLSDINFLHGFLPIEKFNEIDTKIIFERVWRDFPPVKTLAPRVEFQTNEIENLIFKRETKFIENIWQISEPIGNEKIETKKIDALLVPLLCFDKSGFRVGYGKGFYDRFLKQCRNDCLKIGLSYFAPVAEISDAQDFDVKLDFFVSSEKIWQF
ncbi:MAG: 5-formyltetrahydrofolate cyclo-ligase [Acidobacteria bacterium]|jgi:5-formyltetrahydrofolate cyclo-ligase|nr:5-formyltetrahydrofolate cyclo-ligase [Acidobacteriota bacterium]